MVLGHVKKFLLLFLASVRKDREIERDMNFLS
jgi:hypothetical protein